MTSSGRPSQAARCQAHQLVTGPDGLCVLCKCEQTDAPAAVPTPSPVPSFTQRILSWPPAVKLTGVAEAANVLRRTWPGRSLLPLRPPSGPTKTVTATSEPLQSSEGSSPSSPAAGAAAAPPAKVSARPVSGSFPSRNDPWLGGIPSRPSSLRMSGSPGPDSAQVPMVVFYSLSSCSICRSARDYLRSRRVAFVEHDVERDSAAAARALRLNPRRSVPTFDIGGREVLIGFTPSELDDAVARLLADYDGGSRA